MKCTCEEKIKLEYCTANDLIEFIEGLQYALTLCWKEISALRITPENFDLDYIIDEILYVQLGDNLDNRQIELARKVLEVMFLHSNVLFENSELDYFDDEDDFDESDSMTQLEFKFQT